MDNEVAPKEKRARKDVDYNEDETLTVATSKKGSASLYQPSDASDDSDTHLTPFVSKEVKNKSKPRQPNKTDALWIDAADNVILCGQQSLHCHNTGNLLFRDYVHAAVFLFFKFGNSPIYQREYMVDEIYSKLKNHEWRKLEDKTQQLTDYEIRKKSEKR